MKKLLSIDGTKIDHSNKSEPDYLLAIMYMLPSKHSGHNVCAFSSEDCKATCLFTAGRLAMTPAQQCMLARTALFFTDRAAFKAKLVSEIAYFERTAKNRAIKLNHPIKACIRLNGTSDIPWEILFPELFAMFPDVQFYDYTKYPVSLRNNIPENYYLIRSHNEDNDSELDKMMFSGNVAVVFNTKRGEPLPTEWRGYNVIDGDLNDLRFKDISLAIVGLRAKGKARKLTATENGFVVKTWSEKE